MGVAVGDYDNDGRDDVYITALERRPPVPQRGRRQVPRRDQGVRHRQRELRHERGVARLRPRRQAGSVRRQLRAVDAEGRPLVLARRRDEVVLHAGIVQGHVVEAVSQPGRRPVRGREPQGRHRRSDQQVARRHRVRLQQRRLARPVRRQRHAAEQAVSQQQATARSPRRGCRPAWPTARTAWRAARWASTRPTTTAPAAPHLLVGNFSNQMLGLYHNEGNGLFVDEAPTSTVGRASLLSPDLRRVLLRLRPRRLPGHLRGQRPHRGGDRARAAEGAVQAAAAAVPQPRRSASSRTSAAPSAPQFTRPIVARGAAYADFDHDGDLDVLLTTNNGPAYLFRNDGGNQNNWLCIRTRGVKSNRDGIGAVVRIRERAAASSGASSAADRATARRATWR